MTINAKFWTMCMLFSVILSGCSRYQVIPDHLAKQVNAQLSYEQVRNSPEGYPGQIVVWGGEVLHTARDTEKTTVELLEIPLNTDHFPLEGRASSGGRFFALDNRGEIIDPAILKEGSKITVIGEILGVGTEPSNKAVYDYPVLAIRDMTVWEERTRAHYPFAGYSNYYGYGSYGYRPDIRGARVSGSQS